MSETRTQQEILDRIEDRKEDDMFGWEWHEYVGCLDFEHAKPFLKDGADPDNWEFTPPTSEALREKMLDYMDFAWDKACGERGISANRSIMHYVAWVWLEGDNKFAKRVEQEWDLNYHEYGKPILRMICDHYGWDYRQWECHR